MNKLVSKMCAVGALAASVSAAVPPSMAHAQTAIIAVLDPAIAQIQCSSRAEETALECKKNDLGTLQKCLDRASFAITTDAIALADSACDQTATDALTKCQLTGIRADLACRLGGSNGGAPAPTSPPTPPTPPAAPVAGN